MLEAEFGFFDLGWEKADDFVNFVDIDQVSTTAISSKIPFCFALK